MASETPETGRVDAAVMKEDGRVPLSPGDKLRHHLTELIRMAHADGIERLDLHVGDVPFDGVPAGNWTVVVINEAAPETATPRPAVSLRDELAWSYVFWINRDTSADEAVIRARVAQDLAAKQGGYWGQLFELGQSLADAIIVRSSQPIEAAPDHAGLSGRQLLRDRAIALGVRDRKDGEALIALGWRYSSDYPGSCGYWAKDFPATATRPARPIAGASLGAAIALEAAYEAEGGYRQAADPGIEGTAG